MNIALPINRYYRDRKKDHDSEHLFLHVESIMAAIVSLLNY